MTADDSASDIKEFGRKAPVVLKGIFKAFKAFKAFRGLVNKPLKVVLFETTEELNKFQIIAMGDEDASGGFFDPRTNTAYVAKDGDKRSGYHEMSHIIGSAIVRENRALANQYAVELLEADSGLKSFVDQYTEEQQAEEAIVDAIARKVVADMEAGRSLPTRIKDFFIRLLEKFGIKSKVFLEEAKNANEFVALVADAIITGKEISADNFTVSIKDINIDKLSSIDKIKLSERAELVKGINILPLSAIENKVLEPIVYDNLRTGDFEFTNRITGKKLTKKGLMGGVLHPFLKGTNEANVVAAFTELGKTLSIARKIKGMNVDKIGLFLSSKESSLFGNRDLRDFIFGKDGVVENIVTEFGFEEFKADLVNAVSNTSKNFSFLGDTVNAVQNIEELTALMESMSFDTYRAVFTRVFPEVKGTPQSKVLQDKYGMPTRGELVNSASEDITVKAKEGDLISLVTPNPNVILVNEKEFNELGEKKIKQIAKEGIEVKMMPKSAEHPIYPFALEGKADGVMEKFVNARDIFESIPEDATNIYYYAERRKKSVVDTMQDVESKETRDISVEGVSQSVIAAAPIRDFTSWFAKNYKGKTPTAKDIIKIKNSKLFKSYRKRFIEEAKMFNLAVGDIATNIGLWAGALEYSNLLEVKGTNEDIRAYSAYMGLVAEPQEGVAISTPSEQGSDVSMTAIFKNEKDALEAVSELKERGITGLSYDTGKKAVTVFIQNEEEVNTISKYYEENKSKVQSSEQYSADVDFLSEGEYEGILREYGDKRRNEGKDGEKVYNAISEVLSRGPENELLGPIKKMAAAKKPSKPSESKSTRQNIIRPAEKAQEDFGLRYTPKRIGTPYYGQIKILNTLDPYALADMVDDAGVNIGLDFLKEYNKVVPALTAETMPTPSTLRPAASLAKRLREALGENTREKVVGYSRTLLAYLDESPKGMTAEEIIDSLTDAYVQFDLEEFTEEDATFINNNIDEILEYAEEVYNAEQEITKFSDRLVGTAYEGKEGLAKNDIYRLASQLLGAEFQQLINEGFDASISELELTDEHLQTISDKMDGNANFLKLLDSNRKSIQNRAKNDLRNQMVVNGFIESSKRHFKNKVPQKFVKGDLYANPKLTDKILTIIKQKFSDVEIMVLKDYMEYHEVKKLFNTLQSLQHGYLPPMAYGVIRKFQQATKAIEFAKQVGNMNVMVDASGRLIKDRVAARDARDLTEMSEEFSKQQKDKLAGRTTTGAAPYFKQQVNKVVARVYNQISKAFSAIESEREVDVNFYNEKFSRIKNIFRFEGKQYTNTDMNMLGHMYLIERQYLSNPVSDRVPKLYESLISSIKNKNNPENKRYIELFNEFKGENNTLDMNRVKSVLKASGAMTENVVGNKAMGLVNFVEKRMQENRSKVRHLQEYQNKTEVDIFENYVYVATKENSNTGEVKVDMIESLLNRTNSNTLGFAKTSITRQSYRKADGTLRKLQGGREPVFDLMWAANFSTNEVLNAYHLGEAFRDTQAMLNILGKMGDFETQALASLLKGDIRERIINSFEYKMYRANSIGDKFLQKALSGTYRTALASVRRILELFSNSFLVGIANPKVARAIMKNAADIALTDNTINETKMIMDKIGSAHMERFNKTGKAFYSAEGIGNQSVQGSKRGVFDKMFKKGDEYSDFYIALNEQLNNLGKLNTGIANFADAFTRMSDTKIGSIAWNTIFKEQFKEITGVEYNESMLNDAYLYIKYKLAMEQAGDYADVFLKESFAGGAFDMNQRALTQNKGAIKYLQNMFRSFRTFYYESNRNAIRSLIGMADGTMTKEEAARRLTGALVGNMIYTIGSSYLLSQLWQAIFTGLGMGEGSDDDEFKTVATNAAVEFLIMTAGGRIGAIQYAMISGTARGAIRYMNQDMDTVSALERHFKTMQRSDYLMRQSVPVIGQPVMLGLEGLQTMFDAFQGDMKEGDGADLFYKFLREAVVLKGVPFAGDAFSAYYTYKKMNPEPKKTSSKKSTKTKYKNILE